MQRKNNGEGKEKEEEKLSPQREAYLKNLRLSIDHALLIGTAGTTIIERKRDAQELKVIREVCVPPSFFSLLSLFILSLKFSSRPLPCLWEKRISLEPVTTAQPASF